MRLLDKRVLNGSVAQERKRQIDSGVELAKKVDVLRETKLKEEAQLAQFRSESIARTQEEIDAKIKEKNSLESKIEDRKRELLKLREPLDAEWGEVNSKIRGVNALSLSLNQMQGELERGIALNIRRERENEEEKERIAEERERSVQALIEADLSKKEASALLSKARTKSDNLVKTAENKDNLASQREVEVADRERSVEKELKRLKVIEKEQKRKDREIKDKYETLQRDIKRMNYASK